MVRSLVYTSFLVPDCGEALAFFTQVLRWQVREGILLSESKRWLVVAPTQSEGGGGALLLACASTPAQRSLIGRQGGGRVAVFLDPRGKRWDLIQPNLEPSP